MALLFSKVTVTAGNDATSFLVGGIPREYDDLEDWDAVDDFLKYIDEETEVLVHAKAYLYGDGETSAASYTTSISAKFYFPWTAYSIPFLVSFISPPLHDYDR